MRRRGDPQPCIGRFARADDAVDELETELLERARRVIDWAVKNRANYLQWVSLDDISSSGMELVMAANHWSTAIDVHQAAFPDARHDCADITQVDPRRYPVTDILLASPECTNHSQARGVSRHRQDPSLFDAPDPSADRSRATMWDVVRFAETLERVRSLVERPRAVLGGAPPSREYPFGTDGLGLSVLTLVIQGTKISLLVGLTASVITMVS